MKGLSDASNHHDKNTSNNTAATVTATELLAGWIKRKEARDKIPSPEAKKEYFLTASDLFMAEIDLVGGGVGIGPAKKYYWHIHLVRKSLNKHGEEAVGRKLMARYKRNEKKRLKEEQAGRALQRLKAETSTRTEMATGAAAAKGNDSAVKTKVVTDGTAKSMGNREIVEKRIRNLRGEMLALVKSQMTYTFLSKQHPKWRVEVPHMNKAFFAAFMGRPADVELETFVKNGAYITVKQVEASEFFAITNEEQLVKHFDCCSFKIASDVTVHYKPATMHFSATGCSKLYWPRSWDAFFGGN